MRKESYRTRLLLIAHLWLQKHWKELFIQMSNYPKQQLQFLELSLLWMHQINFITILKIKRK